MNWDSFYIADREDIEKENNKLKEYHPFKTVKREFIGILDDILNLFQHNNIFVAIILVYIFILMEFGNRIPSHKNNHHLAIAKYERIFLSLLICNNDQGKGATTFLILNNDIHYVNINCYFHPKYQKRSHCCREYKQYLFE